MVVLGIAPEHGAAALARDGELVFAHTAGPIPHAKRVPVSIEDLAGLCVRQAGISIDAVATLVVVGDQRTADGAYASAAAGAPVRRSISAAAAHLAQAASVAADHAALVVVDPDVEDVAIVAADAGRRDPEPSPALAAAARLATAVAGALGIRGDNPWGGLELIAGDASPDLLGDLAEAALTSCPGTIDAARLACVIEQAARDCPGELSDAEPRHQKVIAARATLAASVRQFAFDAFAKAVNDISARHRVDAIAVSGRFFSNASFNSRLAAVIEQRLVVAPVPEPLGSAIGAALSADGPPRALQHLAVGPVFGEAEIKRVLENCRLEYLYEPEWNRLVGRVSSLLAAGKLVAWFQEPLDFGPRSLGSRSVLCDPSSRFARDNVNTYLLRRNLDAPLGVALPAEAAASCLVTPVDSPYMLLAAEVHRDWRRQLSGALDADGRCAIQTVDDHGNAPFLELLRAHRMATGIPGLINVGLTGALTGTADALVVEPRDAISVAFGSAVDVLVIGRFIVSKDYWLLRSV